MVTNDSAWTWDIDLDNLVGRFAALETTDGMMREGKITKFVTREIELAGAAVKVPEAIELNGDPRDLIEFLRLKSVVIQ
ncbi:hypothetical protein LCGC14_0860710 [marine sediment metagenome]|uniref:Uncharacterized protein n=1 Tax=marine sediment metagenome TaxID=412755 RepID=A0A0F9SEK6_9ZZZZ